MRCKTCSSYAINHSAHGRDGTEPELCDVCFWRKRAEAIEPSPAPVQPQAEPVAFVDAEKQPAVRNAPCGSQPIHNAQPVAYSIGNTLHWHDGRGVSDAQLYAGASAVQLADAGLLAAYADAIDEIESWGNYASDYFQAKHYLAGVLKGHRDRLAAIQAAQSVDAVDAERYRWLRKGRSMLIKLKKSTLLRGPNIEIEYGEALDAAIDAAMKGAK